MAKFNVEAFTYVPYKEKRTIKKLRITNPPFHANIPCLYPPKTPENLFSDVFSGYRNGTLA